MHVHVSHPEGEAKFWVAPSIELARNIGLSTTKLGQVERLVQSRQQGIINAWHDRFGR